MKKPGYSTVPLAKKLGIKSSSSIRIINGPSYYFDLFSDLPSDLKEIVRGKAKADMVHYFTMNTEYLLKDIGKLKQSVKEEGAIWISWPKKSSGIETDISENIIREIIIENGLVDIKVCAIDEIWSALKVVIPVKLRKKLAS